MKKLMLALFLLPTVGFCDTKISALPSTTTLNSSDIFPVVTNPSTNPQNFTISKANLLITLGIAPPYISPTVSLGTSPSGQTLELGNNISNISVSAFTVEHSSPITSLALKKNGTSFYLFPSPTPTGGNQSYIDTATLTTTTIYTATVGDGTSTNTSNSVTFSFVYPFYYGVGAQALSGSSVQGLTKLLQTQQNTATTTSPTNQVYYFAYPQAYGSLSSIIDQNGFNVTAGYTQRSATLTMLDSTNQPYYIYEFNTLTTQTNFKNTYNF